MKLSNGKVNQWNEYIVVSHVLSGYWLEGCVGSVEACVRAETRQTWWGSWRWPLSRETPDQDGTGYAWRIQLLPSWVYENKYGLEKIILGNLKIKWKFKLQTRVSGNWWIVWWKPPKLQILELIVCFLAVLGIKLRTLLSIWSTAEPHPCLLNFLKELVCWMYFREILEPVTLSIRHLRRWLGYSEPGSHGFGF